MKRKVLLKKRYSDHPADHYLSIALCELEDNKYSKFAVWLYNSDDEGYYDGAYFVEMKDALKNYDEGGVKV